MLISIIISDQATWPADVIEYLEKNLRSFFGWECACTRNASAQEYDSAIYGMRELLKEHSLIGYHCTKLTENEIESIRENGLLLQNGDSLNKRILQLEKDGLIESGIALELSSRNQANDSNRALMLWFCFFEPYLAGKWGIERFFRSWGGEALYNSHEADPLTGPALRGIGTPCVIKASVPIKTLKSSYYPDSSMIRAFLSLKGHELDNGIEHEGFSTTNIGPESIIDIYQYPSKEFNNLTKFNEWSGDSGAL